MEDLGVDKPDGVVGGLLELASLAVALAPLLGVACVLVCAAARGLLARTAAVAGLARLPALPPFRHMALVLAVYQAVRATAVPPGTCRRGVAAAWRCVGRACRRRRSSAALDAGARGALARSAGDGAAGGDEDGLGAEAVAVRRLAAAAGRQTRIRGVARGHEAVGQADGAAFLRYAGAYPAETPLDEPWERIIKERTARLTYVCHRRVYPDNTTAYLSSTVVENCTPHALMRFYVTDEHRVKWDTTYGDGAVLESDPATGAEAVWWKRNFPLWCAPRDYVFTRRTFAARTDAPGDTFVTVSKTCEHAAKPEDGKGGAIRVHVFESSWICRPARGRDGTMSAAEVVLFHYEDMHLPHNVARFAVTKGMWPAVKSMEAKGFQPFEAKYLTPEAVASGAAFTSLPASAAALAQLQRQQDEAGGPDQLEASQQQQHQGRGGAPGPAVVVSGEQKHGGWKKIVKRGAMLALTIACAAKFSSKKNQAVFALLSPKNYACARALRVLHNKRRSARDVML